EMNLKIPFIKTNTPFMWGKDAHITFRFSCFNISKLGVVAHAFILESETGESLSSRPAWSTEQVPGQPEPHSKTLS
ncbi:mCG144516, partial [Mus musculus]